MGPRPSDRLDERGAQGCPRRTRLGTPRRVRHAHTTNQRKLEIKNEHFFGRTEEDRQAEKAGITLAAICSTSMTPHRSRLYHRLEAGWWSSSGRVPQTVVMIESMYINSMIDASADGMAQASSKILLGPARSFWASTRISTLTSPCGRCFRLRTLTSTFDRAGACGQLIGQPAHPEDRPGSLCKAQHITKFVLKLR